MKNFIFFTKISNTAKAGEKVSDTKNGDDGVQAVLLGAILK